MRESKNLLFKSLSIFLLIVFLLFCFRISLAKDVFEISLPKNFDEAKAKFWEAIKYIPQILKILWQKLLSYLERAYFWAQNIWNSKIEPYLFKIENYLKEKFKQRKPIIKEELKKEEKELKKEASGVWRRGWEKIKQKIKNIF